MYTTEQGANGRWVVYKDGVALQHWSYSSKVSAQRFIRRVKQPKEEPTMNVIGIAGKAESGKDTAAGFITACYPHSYYRRAFADALKVEAMKAWHKDDGLVATEDREDWWLVRAADHLKLRDPEFRSFLQDLGHARRELDADYWINRLARDHMSHPRYGLIEMVVPDVRYRNEVEYVLGMGGLVLRLERPGHENRLTPEQRLHASETDLDEWPESARYRIIENHGNPVELLDGVLREVDAYRGWRR